MPREVFVEHAQEAGLTLCDRQLQALEQLSQWAARLAEASAITGYDTPAQALARGMMPALAYLALPGAPRSGTLADLGAGAGMLGATLAIVAPDLQVDLVDRAQRAFTACELLVAELALDNLGARLLEVGREPMAGPCYDAVILRAVAGGAEALLLAGALVVPGGFVAAWHREGNEQFTDPPPDFEVRQCVPTNVEALVATGYRFCPR